jgi:hypothetical protein
MFALLAGRYGRTGNSWGGRTRTCNFPINSRAVCQLTYAPSIFADTTHKKARQIEIWRALQADFARAHEPDLPGELQLFDFFELKK